MPDGSTRCPIQKQEKETLPNGQWRTYVNPTRILVTPSGIRTQAELLGTQTTNRLSGKTDKTGAATRNHRGPVRGLSEYLQIDKLKKQEVMYKWDISKNGTLVIGEVLVNMKSTGADERKKVKLGHTTLVGGREIPEARISGMLFAEGDNLMINNDSGRFSEYEDRKPGHLDAVERLFEKNGLPVQTRWVQKEPIPLAAPPKKDK